MRNEQRKKCVFNFHVWDFYSQLKSKPFIRGNRGKFIEIIFEETEFSNGFLHLYFKTVSFWLTFKMTWTGWTGFSVILISTIKTVNIFLSISHIFQKVSIRPFSHPALSIVVKRTHKKLLFANLRQRVAIDDA